MAWAVHAMSNNHDVGTLGLALRAPRGSFFPASSFGALGARTVEAAASGRAADMCAPRPRALACVHDADAAALPLRSRRRHVLTPLPPPRRKLHIACLFLFGIGSGKPPDTT
ncbi:unnamed protein product [Prorocentrum cordatum]|uniref:Uncharacterized protein n=1 Tax=Prorocentrum cordatum TaxID=2364126 RepID=A0ABN9VKU0_9DINO|nr:unnamed protein product [Polarella glacialis]